ncbi:MAG: DNA lyase [Candidatus Aenigmarchaeota archaeon]|nr:DNA lyase [Candidatus Aenigmarchaeota archaeon]
MDITELKKFHETKKDDIRSRLRDFAETGKDNKKIFIELCFCLCTPRSSAVKCDRIIKQLASNGLLFKGTAEEIRKYMDEISFPDEKAKYMMRASERFIDKKINFSDFFKKFLSSAGAREWLIKNVNGLGRKEASHFLRNIGLGKEFAILDVHIMRNLKWFSVIDEGDELTDKKYMEIETKMKKFSKEIGIPMDELDLLLWCKETGFIFK